MSLKSNELLIISYCNYFYREIALNWVEALSRLGIKNYLIFSIDEKCHDFLKKKGVNSRLHIIEGLPEKQAQGGLTRKMGMERFVIIRSLLEDGMDVVYSDLDAVWTHDPLKKLCTFSDHHLVASTIRHSHSWPPKVAQEWGFTLCTGWFGVKSCPETIAFLHGLSFFYENCRRPPPGVLICCDQDALNSYLVDLESRLEPCGGHQASIIVPSFAITVLAIHPTLVHRGGGSPGSMVVHPVSGKKADATKGKLQSKNLWFLNE